MTTKTIEEWEHDQQIMINNIDNPKAKLSFEDFEAVKFKNGFTGVDFPKREKFLTDNGYQITRANLTKDLSAKSD